MAFGKKKPVEQPQPQSTFDKYTNMMDAANRAAVERRKAENMQKQAASQQSSNAQSRQDKVNEARTFAELGNRFAPTAQQPMQPPMPAQQTQAPPMQQMPPMAPPMQQAAPGSLVGKQASIGRREYQQDALEISFPVVDSLPNHPWLAILCDGMGGMNGGEKASATCIEQMLCAFIGKDPNERIPDFYENAIIDIDDMVNNLTDENGEYLGAGSTLISVVIDGEKLFWASVGDSHIYVIRGNEMVQVNQEHNYLQDLLQMVKEGRLTAEEAYSDPSKEALTSFMGIGEIDLMDINQKPFKLKNNDCVILCSDGLYRALSDDEIKAITIRNAGDMQNAANELVASALNKGNPHQDNTSVITIRYNR